MKHNVRKSNVIGALVGLTTFISLITWSLANNQNENDNMEQVVTTNSVTKEDVGATLAYAALAVLAGGLAASGIEKLENNLEAKKQENAQTMTGKNR